MSQPTKRRGRKSCSSGIPASDVDKFLNAFRTLDRTVVEISMHIYKIPHRDRTAMLKQHRRLHDTVRKRLPRFLYLPHQDTELS
jgi:hypothetical protein